MKTILITYLFLFCFLLTGKAQTQQEVSYFPLQDVKLLESPFLQAQQTDLHYIIPTGKTPDWTDTSADITFPHSP